MQSLHKRIASVRDIMRMRGASAEEMSEMDDLIALLPTGVDDPRYTTPLEDGILKKLYTKYGGRSR